LIIEIVRGDTEIVWSLFDKTADLLADDNQRSKKLVHQKSFPLGVTPSGLWEVVFPASVATIVLEEIKCAEDKRDVTGQRRHLLEKTKVTLSCLTFHQVARVW
jgi:hypothetical protein